MATPMSDDELRAKLKELGEDIGPVTDSTRILWRKKLDRLLADRKNQRRKVEASSSSVALSLIQYSSDDSESDVNKNALDRPVPRSRRRTSNRFASDSSSLASQEKTLNISSDGDFKKPTGIPKSWRNTKQSSGLSPGHQAPAALPRLARPSLRSLTSAGRSNGVMPEFESSDSDIDEPNNRRSTRSTRRHRSTPADEDSVATSGSGSPYPGMRGSKRSESSERSKLNDSSTVWEGKTQPEESKRASEASPPKTGNQGTKRKAFLLSSPDIEAAALSQPGPKRQCAASKGSSEATQQQSMSEVGDGRKGKTPLGNKEIQPQQNADEPAMQENLDNETQMKNLQFIQLQIDLAKAEHAMKMEMIQKEHEYKMKQLQLMMTEYRERLSLPLSP